MRWIGVVGMALVATAVSAAVPAADGSITGCYAKKTGKLRVVDGKPCKKGEVALTWSQTGPQGDAGQPGAPGTAATQIFAFAQTWRCCGGSGGLVDPPTVHNARGITAATREAAGRYVVTVDRDVTQCLAVASIFSNDAAFPQAGMVGVGRPGGIPPNQFQVLLRDATGALADVGSNGGTYGFTIAVFCP